MATEKNFTAGETIVIEDDFVDSFYLVSEGKVEITKKTFFKGKKENIILAVLEGGDAIGLHERGVFSPNTRRTASAIALSETKTLCFGIESFNLFIKERSEFDEQIKATVELLVKINFVKQTSPFIYLNNDEIYSLASLIKEISLPPNTLLFNKGDHADCCYLIYSGQIEIFIKDVNSVERQIAILESPKLLGEAALLTNAPRNASSRTLTSCKLFSLERDVIYELARNSETFAQSMIGIMVNRFCPRKKEGILEHHSTKDGEILVMLQDTELHHYYRLGEVGWFIWQQLDGLQTIQDLTILFFKKYKAFAPEMICNLLFSLAEMGFVVLPSITDTLFESHKKKTIISKTFNKVKKFTQKELAFSGTDDWLTNVYRNGVSSLFTWLPQVLFMLVAVAGIATFFALFPRIMIQAQTSHPNIFLWLLFIIPISSIAVILHEAAHAFVAKKLGYKVQRIGLGWHWGLPFAYVDTSELWLANRHDRFLVNIAGAYMDCLVGGLLALLALLARGNSLAVYLWLYSLLIYFNAFKNLSPLGEFDGYFLLSDILDRNRLRKTSIRWLIQVFQKSEKIPKPTVEHYYWLACACYIILSFTFLVSVLHIFFKIFGFTHILGIPALTFSFIFALCLLSLSLLYIWREIKNVFS
jgi:putative peptide zinc metalloprotease protein